MGNMKVNYVKEDTIGFIYFEFFATRTNPLSKYICDRKINILNKWKSLILKFMLPPQGPPLLKVHSCGASLLSLSWFLSLPDFS
jgi:hypothetical protein